MTFSATFDQHFYAVILIKLPGSEKNNGNSYKGPFFV